MGSLAFVAFKQKDSKQRATKGGSAEKTTFHGSYKRRSKQAWRSTYPCSNQTQSCQNHLLLLFDHLRRFVRRLLPVGSSWADQAILREFRGSPCTRRWCGHYKPKQWLPKLHWWWLRACKFSTSEHPILSGHFPWTIRTEGITSDSDDGEVRRTRPQSNSCLHLREEQIQNANGLECSLQWVFIQHPCREF